MTGHANARVHGDDGVRPGDHGVEVKLGDLRQVVGEPRDAEQGIAHRPDVGRRAARLPEQGRRGANGVDQVVGVGIGERGQPGRVVTEHVGSDPAQAEYHHRAEHRFLDHADDCLDAAGDHGLHQHSG